MKMKELLKRALNHPELFTEGELMYFRRVQRDRKLAKKQEEAAKKEAKAKANQTDFLS